MMLLAAVLGMGLTSSALSQCPVVGECVIARFRGFPEFPDRDLKVLVGSAEGGRDGGQVTDPEYRADTALNWSVVSPECINAYSYAYPGMLFPPGSKFDDYQLCWELLCGDAFSCTQPDYTFNIDRLEWHGQKLEVYDANGNVIPGLRFRHKGGTLTIGEVIETPTGRQVTAAHLELPGHREVWLSLVAQDCR